MWPVCRLFPVDPSVRVQAVEYTDHGPTTVARAVAAPSSTPNNPLPQHVSVVASPQLDADLSLGMGVAMEAGRHVTLLADCAAVGRLNEAAEAAQLADGVSWGPQLRAMCDGLHDVTGRDVVVYATQDVTAAGEPASGFGGPAAGSKAFRPSWAGLHGKATACLASVFQVRGWSQLR